MNRRVVILLLAILFACEKNECNCNNGNIIGIWEATDFFSLESHYYFKNDEFNPRIEFKKDGTLIISLDVNSCFSDFYLSVDLGIKISGVGCTEICCDSEFSEKFAGKLPQVTSYQIEDNILRLNAPDWGFIKLQKISE